MKASTKATDGRGGETVRLTRAAIARLGCEATPEAVRRRLWDGIRAGEEGVRRGLLACVDRTLKYDAGLRDVAEVVVRAARYMHWLAEGHAIAAERSVLDAEAAGLRLLMRKR